MLDSLAAAAWLRISTDHRVMVSTSGLDAEAVESLAASGLISVCAWEGGEVATLSPLAAERLGVRISSTSGGGWVWTSKDARVQRRRPRKGRTKTETLDAEAVADPGLTAEDFAVLNERIEAYAVEGRANRRQRLDDEQLTGRHLPRPAVILTGSDSSWAEFVRPRGVCSVCLGLPLGPSTYCLRCDRWGLDWLLARIKAAEARAEKRAKEAAKFKPKRKRDKASA